VGTAGIGVSGITGGNGGFPDPTPAATVRKAALCVYVGIGSNAGATGQSKTIHNQ